MLLRRNQLVFPSKCCERWQNKLTEYLIKIMPRTVFYFIISANTIIIWLSITWLPIFLDLFIFDSEVFVHRGYTAVRGDLSNCIGYISQNQSELYVGQYLLFSLVALWYSHNV